MTTLDPITDILFNFLVYGLLVTLLVQMILSLVGSAVRFRITYLKRRILKRIRPYKIDLTLTLEPTVGIVGELDATRKLLVEKLSDRKIDFTERTTSVKFAVSRNHVIAQAECFFGLSKKGEVDSFEVVLAYPAAYGKFADDFQNLTETMIYLEDILRATFPEVQEFQRTLSFAGLKHLPETMGILSDGGALSLSTKKKDVRLDFAGDTVSLYGNINTDLRKLVQSIVTYYC